MKIFLADDAALIREGLAGILARTGHEIVGQADNATDLVKQVRAILAAGDDLDIVITDVRMPPTHTDDGLRAAVQLREQYPELPIMVLSQYVAPAYAAQLFEPKPGVPMTGGLGYVLKDRVSKIVDFVRSLELVANGGITVDPEVAAGLMRNRAGALDGLTPREREVLELMARGLSNNDIAAELYLSGAAVSKHVANVFTKLGLAPGEDNRRVRAVLAYLTATGHI
ncbi:MAG: response regulator transcription factor [Actinomycetaceae bacterium]|nr:response regulator transcription factor [Actinomycetaceae bacterium]